MEDSAQTAALIRVTELFQALANAGGSPSQADTEISILQELHSHFRQCPEIVLAAPISTKTGTACTPLTVMAQKLRQMVDTSPSAIKPVLGWDGQIEGYTTGKQCQPMLQCWLELLTQVSCSHPPAARELYKLGVTSVLQEICTQYLDDQSGLVSAAEELWAWLALHNTQVTDELMLEVQVHGLLGIASNLQVLATRQARAASLVVRALGKLAEVVDGCSGDHFTAMIRPDGILNILYSLLSSAPTAASAVSGTASGQTKQPDVDSKLLEASRCFMLRCYERVQQNGGLGGSKGNPAASWFATCDHHGLAQLMAQLAQTPGAHRGCSDHPSCQAEVETTPLAAVSKPQDSAPGLCARDIGNTADVDEDTGYDSDGLKPVYSSGPTPPQQSARSSWLNQDLRDKVSWVQTSDALDLWLKLPSGTQKCELSVSIKPTHLTVSLSWAGRVLDGPLARRVKASEATWVIERQAAGSEEEVLLHIMLPKDELHFWRAVFEGAPERSHIEVLREAVEADEPVQGWDQLEPDARELVEEFRERQWMISQGHLDLENSFDDFRLVVGDGML